MDIGQIQNQINMTEYWDVNILDLQIMYFGDEVYLYVYNDGDNYWKISFLKCLKITYTTDADRRGIACVRDMKKPQLGYYGQKITVLKSDNDDFCKVLLDLSIMTIEIVCNQIRVDEVAKEGVRFFWQE